MEQGHLNTIVAGIDVGKSQLDAAVLHGGSLQVSNDADGIGQLLAWLDSQAVTRVGIEATGGYERQLRTALEAAGLAVSVHQPLEVKLFGRFSRQHAKTDAGDARLIAAATAALDRQPKPADAALTALAERLTVYEHVADQLMRLKTFLESLTLEDLRQAVLGQIEHLRQLKAELLRALVGAIKADPQLQARYQLLTSMPGIGPVVAASLVIRMPELGRLERGQAASLIGVAPHPRDSGLHKGQRFISGGRARPRRMLYIAALVASRFDPDLSAFANRLKQAGKPPKIVIVELMRKLIEAANLVLKRNSPWIKKTA